MTTRREDMILACLREQDAARREAIEQFLLRMGQRCSRVTLLRDLGRLADFGLVERSGRGRAVRYALSRYSIQTQPIDVDAYFSKEADERSLRSEYFNFDLFSELQHLLMRNEMEDLDTRNAEFRRKMMLLTPRLRRTHC